MVVMHIHSLIKETIATREPTEQPSGYRLMAIQANTLVAHQCRITPAVSALYENTDTAAVSVAYFLILRCLQVSSLQH